MSGQGLTCHPCTTPPFVNMRIYIFTHMCTHIYIPVFTLFAYTPVHTLCVHIYTRMHIHLHAHHIHLCTFEHKPETESGTHLCAHTQTYTAFVCMGVSIPHRYMQLCVPGGTFQGGAARPLLGPPGYRPLAKAPPGGHLVYTPAPPPSPSAPGTSKALVSAQAADSKRVNSKLDFGAPLSL